ncbi:MAG: spore coat protein U domain-containing protein [Pseudoxanthomonas sp.]
MRKTSIALGLVAAIAAMPAFAATSTGSLTVKATVVSSCAVNTNTAGTVTNAVLDFGNITTANLGSSIDADTTGSGGTSLTVLCSNGTNYTYYANYGSNASGNQRRMANGTEMIAYDLYSNQARSTAFPTSGSTASATGNGSVQSYTIYGRIPALSSLPTAGTYTDTVTLTVEY